MRPGTVKSYCKKFCIAKIVKWDFFGIAITEKYVKFSDHDRVNSKSQKLN